MPPSGAGTPPSPAVPWQNLSLARAARPPLPTLPHAPLLRVGPSATLLDARRLSGRPTPRELRQALGLPTPSATATMRQPGSGPQAPILLHLAIAPATGIMKIVSLLEALAEAGRFELSFLVEPAVSPLLPAAPDPGHQVDLERVLARASPPRRRELLRRRLAVMAHRANCGALDTLMATVLRSARERQCPQLARALPAVVTRCACRLDWRRLLTMMRVLFGPYRYVGTWTGRPNPALALARPPPPTVITGPKHARWLDVVGRLVELPTAEFWIRPI